MRYTLTVDRGAIPTGGPAIRIEEADLPERLVRSVSILGPSYLGPIPGGRIAVKTDGPVLEGV